MAEEKRKMRLPVIAVILLAATFVSGALAGAFMYATGKAVVENPLMSMVSHTEYRFGESGQIIARLVDFQGNPVSVSGCNATILYPDKTVFVNFAAMTPSVNISGDEYYTFTTPTAGPEGVYEYQATCFYSGNKNASVTNSFHLSSGFNSVLGNISLVNGNVLAVQGNLTVLSVQVASVNASLGAQISNLSSQLNANTTQILTAIANTNSSLYQAIQNINSTVNLSPVLNAIANLNAGVAANFTFTNGLVNNVAAGDAGNFSLVFTDLGQINATSNNVYALLQAVNVTDSNIYSYVTGTLTLKIDSVLSSLGIINDTVNRIETNTQQINQTANSILANQQNQVQMSVSSG